MTLKPLVASLRAHDVTVICFAQILTLVNLVFHERIPAWPILVASNTAVSIAIALIAYRDDRKPGGLAGFVHLWYLVPLIFLTYKELYLMIYPIHGRDYDDLFIAIDRWLFGSDPTVWLSRFAHPAVTEILQIAYSIFYFLLIVVAVELSQRTDRTQFFTYAFLVVYGFYLSYVGYFLLPAVGPRFTLHDFDALNRELPGLLLTNLLRDFVNAGESIPQGVANAVAYAQRDVFPSGHAMMMLVMMHVAVLYRLKIRWFVLVTGALLVIGTVYLRYHYVVDVVAGVLFYAVCMWTGPRSYAAWESVRRRF